MPEGPLGFPRLTKIGPLSRVTEEELRKSWSVCPRQGTPQELCRSIKFHAVAILEDQGYFAECDDLVDINSGFCFDIVEQAFDEIDDDGVRVLNVGDGDHVWLEYNGLHFDAEAPGGVSDWRKLPFFSRIPRHKLLRFARMAAESEGREKPETLEDTISDVTEEYSVDFDDDEPVLIDDEGKEF